MKLASNIMLGLGILTTASPLAIGTALAQTTIYPPPPVTQTPLAPASPRTPGKANASPQMTTIPSLPRSALGNSEPGAPHSLTEAFAAAYTNDPQLQAERAKVRATDEGVPQALAGWRPTITASASAGYAYTGERITQTNSHAYTRSTEAGVTVTQPIWQGGHTRAATNEAEDHVMGERARLITQEETTFTNVISAYVGVIEAAQVLQLQISNEQVLTKQLQATNDRFKVGEITRTDVAQAEAALASAKASRETAEGNLATARATYQRDIGFLPPGDLAPPQPLALPVKTQQEAISLAVANNPSVVAALYDNAAAKDAVDTAYSALMPKITLQGQGSNASSPETSASGPTNLSALTTTFSVTANLQVPIYQGGSEYAAIRQAKQSQQQAQKLIDDAKRAATQSTVQAWETLIAARATVDSTRVAIAANRTALEGVEREAIVGSRTTLDVLTAQQTLLDSEVTLVQNLAQLVTASYSVASAVGRLTARDLNLPVPLYDETAYYQAVRDRWAGTGDYATDQPGR